MPRCRHGQRPCSSGPQPSRQPTVPIPGGIIDRVNPFDLLSPGRCPACRSAPATARGCCDACLETLFQPIRLPGLLALGYYRGGLRSAIRSYKFRGARWLAGAFGSALAQAVEAAPWKPAAVTFVPLHPKRKAERGFDQAELLAIETARRLRVPCLRALRRMRSTRRQSRLTPAARRANTSGAFAGSGPVEGELLLVDDVFTTGATLSACSAVLLQAGAVSVKLGVLALAAKRSPLAATDDPDGERSKDRLLLAPTGRRTAASSGRRLRAG